jgi:hypothetical protein
MQPEENILALIESSWTEATGGKQIPEDGWCINSKILWKEIEDMVVEISANQGWSLKMSVGSEWQEILLH